tara:strand:+ start:3426 stop:4445 length:1020 start_codon:yes stop_codon:yes gene_type:complete
MSYYQKFDKNYWDRKVFDKKDDFDLRLLRNVKLDPQESKKIFKEYVELVCLELSYYCNRACNYCPVHTMERSDKKLEIPETVLNSVTDSLSEIDYSGRISLNLFNEPLASKNIFKNISYISKKVPKSLISLNSNGDYIKEIGYLEKLEKNGLKEILITMHTPKNREWNKDYSTKQLIKFAKKVNYNLTDKNLKELNFSFFVGKLIVEVFCTDWTKEGNSRGGLLKDLSEKKRTTPCEKPMREFVIAYDGTTQLCCHIYHNKKYDKKISTIDPKKDIDIFKIYTSKVLSQTRKELFDYSEKKGLCATCNHYEDNIKQDSSFFYNKEKDELRRLAILKKIK